jgi:hypothetical protein
MTVLVLWKPFSVIKLTRNKDHSEGKPMKKLFLGIVLLSAIIAILSPSSSKFAAQAQSTAGSLAGEAPYDFDSMKPVWEVKEYGVIDRFYGCVRLQKEIVKCVLSHAAEQKDQYIGIDVSRTFYVSSFGQRTNATRVKFGLPGDKDISELAIYPNISVASEFYLTIPENLKSIPLFEAGIKYVDGNNWRGYARRATQVAIR